MESAEQRDTGFKRAVSYVPSVLFKKSSHLLNLLLIPVLNDIQPSPGVANGLEASHSTDPSELLISSRHRVISFFKSTPPIRKVLHGLCVANAIFPVCIMKKNIRDAYNLVTPQEIGRASCRERV